MSMKTKLIIALVALPVVFGAFKVSDRVTFDRAQWLADFEQLKQEIEANYANLKWAEPAKEVDFVALNETAFAALEDARTTSEARGALAAFIRGFKDPHFHLESAPPRPVSAILDLWPESRPPRLNYSMKAGEICDALGFNSKRLFIQIDHPGIEEDEDKEFAAGVMTVSDGRKFAIIRIPRFQQYDYGASCERAWQSFATNRTGVCDEGCQDEFYEAAKHEAAATLAREARALAAVAPAGLVIDLTGNGGGTEWADNAAAALTPKTLQRPAGAFVRGPHWRRAFREDADAFRKKGLEPDYAIARAMEDSASVECDVSAIWKNRAARPACWNVVTQTPYPSVDHFEELKQANPYAGKLFIMVDESTASASELFAAILQDNGVAQVIGETTMGVGCGYTNGGIDITLRNSKLGVAMPDCARMRKNGSNEYEGVKPDIAANWGESESSKGVALEKALLTIQ